MRICHPIAWLSLCLCPFVWAQGFVVPADVEEQSPAAMYTMPNAEQELVQEPPTRDELFAQAKWLYQNHSFDDALALFRKSADQGHTEAQYMTGLMLSRGEGVPLACDDEAARYFAMASLAGYPKAQVELGLIYYNGTETLARNNAEAYKWFYQASLQGEPKALQMLSRVQKEFEANQPATAQSIQP